MPTVLMVIANEGFQDTEYLIPRQILEQEAQVTIASKQQGLCSGALGQETVEATHAIGEIQGSDYDMIVFVGGPGAYQAFWGDPDYARLAKEANNLGAICIAPTILSPSGIFSGKKVTGRDQGGQQIATIEQHGASYIHEDVVTDGNIVTANGPHAAEAFGHACADLLLS